MAKSSLDLRGAKASKLELDFLKLAYAVKLLAASGAGAMGYLLVLNDSIKRTVENWITKYGTGDTVRVLVEAPGDVELKTLRAEKLSNARVLLKEGKLEEAEKELAVAKFGKTLGESALRREIIKLHPTVHEITNAESMPINVAWDFYGILN